MITVELTEEEARALCLSASMQLSLAFERNIDQYDFDAIKSRVEKLHSMTSALEKLGARKFLAEAGEQRLQEIAKSKAEAIAKEKHWSEIMEAQKKKAEEEALKKVKRGKHDKA